MLDPATLLQQLLLVPAEQHGRDIRGELFHTALRHATARPYRHAVLRQLAQEPDAFRFLALRDSDRILDIDELADDLPLFARIVASTAGNDVGPHLMRRGHDRLGAPWPIGADEVFRRAFAGEGLPVPPWVEGILSHGRSINEVE
ncbi:hypothetical protein [Cryptosporangium arvum]|uniref:hypothetical protein n=1 Tax=Cryptosporangium arvum TaxID=80871 RepID=UPI00056273F0|nr:hypothetical protein [Cryptosporangium arvum]